MGHVTPDIHTSRTWFGCGLINQNLTLPRPSFLFSPHHTYLDPSGLFSNSGRPVGLVPLDSRVAVKMPAPVVVKGKGNLACVAVPFVHEWQSPSNPTCFFPCSFDLHHGGRCQCCMRVHTPSGTRHKNDCLLSSRRPRMQWRKPTSRVDRELTPADPSYHYLLCD